MRRRILLNGTPLNLSLGWSAKTYNASSRQVINYIYNNGAIFSGQSASDFTFTVNGDGSASYNTNGYITVTINPNENNYARNLQIVVKYRNNISLTMNITQSADAISGTTDYTSWSRVSKSETPVKIYAKFDTPTTGSSGIYNFLNKHINGIPDCNDEMRLSLSNCLVSKSFQYYIITKVSAQKTTKTYNKYISGRNELINTVVQDYSNVYYKIEGTNSGSTLNIYKNDNNYKLVTLHSSYESTKIIYSDINCTQQIEANTSLSLSASFGYEFRCNSIYPYQVSITNNDVNSSAITPSSQPQFNASDNSTTILF